MAYTSSDLASIEAAILALATGSRQTRATVGDKTFEFAPADLPQLEALRSTIQASIGSGSLRTYAANGGRGLWPY